MSLHTDFIKQWTPPILDEALKPLLGRAIYFKGRFHDWKGARANSSGYDSEFILEKVKHAQFKVMSGGAAFERDSVLFDSIQYSFPVLAALHYAAAHHGGRLSVLDFGGALGSSYFQCLPFLDGLNSLEWSVVEQANFVRCGERQFTTDRLKFFESIACCLERRSPNVALLSSVLQYVPEPYVVLDELMDSGFPLIVMDRTPLSMLEDDFVTIQHVPKNIYPATYPSWIFSRSRLQSHVSPRYEIMAEFDSADGRACADGTPFTFGGMILRNRDRGT